MVGILLNRTAVLLVVGSVFLTGCGPREEPGALPLTSASQPIKRLRVVRGFGNTRHHHTVWDLGDGPIEPMERIAALRSAVPEELIEKLGSTRTVQRKKVGAPPVERPNYCSWGTVVSLDPDIMIVTVREVPDFAKQHPFEGWLYGPAPRAQREYMKRHLELIGTLGITLSYHAGTLLPWSSEMYVVSCDPDVVTGDLTFVDDRAEIPFPGGQLVVVHKDGEVAVERR